MEFALFLFIIFVVFDLVAWRWGVDSRDTRTGSDWYLLQPVQHRA